jgi:rubrerythrin
MTADISYFITGGSALTLLTLWFFYIHQVIICKKKEVLRAEEQVGLLRECFQKMRNSPEEASAGRMLGKSIQSYKQAERIYNETLQKPACRIPASLMGFRRTESTIEDKVEEPVIYTCEDCGFLFYGAGEIRECPYCGGQRVHASTREQTETLQLFLQQVTLDTFG